MSKLKQNIKRALKIEQYSTINQDTANFMLQNRLVIRNSNTKQLISRHYGKRIYPEAHGLGSGRYCVPLWTIAIKELHEGLKQEYGSSGNYEDIKKIKSRIDEYTRGQGMIYLPGTILSFSNSFLSASKQELAEHFSNYIERIRFFIGPFVPLAYHAGEPNFDYELLVSRDSSLMIDDCGRYATGGRAHSEFNSKSIKYRVTINELEMNFLKSIVRGERDDHIPGINECSTVDKGKNVATAKDTLRRWVGRQLAEEIIVAKLVTWLNCQGKKKQIITLDRVDLELLFARSIQKNRSKIAEAIKEDHRIYAYEQVDYWNISKDYGYKSLNIRKKNDDQKFTMEFRKMLQTQQDKTWYYSIMGQSFWSKEQQPNTLKKILEHACNDRTVLGYRNRSFEVCKLLGWLNDQGQLTKKFRENQAMKEAHEYALASSTGSSKTQVLGN